MRQLAFYKESKIAAFLRGLRFGVLGGDFCKIVTLLDSRQGLFDLLLLAFDLRRTTVLGIHRYFPDADSRRPVEILDIRVVVFLHFVGCDDDAAVDFTL